jgi:hypothetical protein
MSKRNQNTAEAIETSVETQVAETSANVNPITPAANTLTSEQDTSVRAMKTKSEQIRYLAALGWKTGAIAKHLSTLYPKPVIYQHVRNVLKQPLKSA